MRAYELYETDPIALGLYDPAQDQSVRQITDTRKPRITLRLLNRLKRIRNSRRRELEKKLAFLPVIYGDTDIHDERAEMAAEQEKAQHELELARLELERDRLAIEGEIEAAELDNEQREHIRGMAMRAMGRARKG